MRTTIRSRALRLGVLALILVSPTAVSAVERDDWALLLEERYIGPIPVPEEGLVLDIDLARFRLRSGSIWLQTPLSSGAIVGLAFEGDGHLLMNVPDRIELTQFRRYLEDEEIERFDTNLDRLVLQTSEIEIVQLLSSVFESSARAGSPDELATERLSWVSERQERWREIYGRDPAARTIGSLRNFGGRYSHAELRTNNHGWLVVEYDDHRAEELVVQSFEARGSFLAIFNKIPFPTLETWLSLDRTEDRRVDGGPNGQPNHGSRLVHLQAEVDLVRPGRLPRGGIGNSHSVHAEMRLTTRFRALRDGLGSLRLQLDPMSVIDTVHSGAGTPLEVLRYNTGEFDLSKDDRLHNPELVVLLDQPVFAGDETELVFTTEIELIDHAGGLHWYPTPVETDFESHTAELVFRHRRDTGVVTLGDLLESERADDGKMRTRYRVEQPTSMIGFSFAQRPHSVRVATESGLPVTFFGTTNGAMSKKRVGTLSDEVVSTLDYYDRFFGFPIGTEQLVISLTESDAQAFPGLIQLWNGFVIDGGQLGDNDHGFAEHFVAHELAHLWWGHQVGWASYRDYWLIESLAEYTAFLYIESELERGDKVAERILTAYTNSVTGSLRGRFDSFSSWTLAFGSMSGAGRGAPLSHGGRARISEMPGGAYSNLYRKGMLVLHMIRMQALAQTGDDQAFFEMLRHYAQRFRGQKPSTQNFREVVAEHIDGDWERFFGQWIDGAEIPTLRWRQARSEASEGGWRVSLAITSSDVPPEFAFQVPVLFEHADGHQERRLLEVENGSNQLDVELAGRPLKITFNESHGVLARMRDRDRNWRRTNAP